MEIHEYVEKFNAADEECYTQLISNNQALSFLMDNAPRLFCPDAVIEETFAFRTWTLRKHFKMTADGLVLTEFLPKVPWSGLHNTISAPLFHHLNESRWFKNSDELLDYISLFLDEKADTYAYSTPAVWEILNFLKVTGNLNYAVTHVEKLENYVATFENMHALKNGLFWSIDGCDAMEFSISGTTPDLESLKGVRPTLNSYMFGAYAAMAEIEKLCGNEEKANHYEEKAQLLKKAYNIVGFDGDFYKAIHLDVEALNGNIDCSDIPGELNVRELIGYIPFIYGLGSIDQSDCFKYLKDATVFSAKTGFATADISHPRFLYRVNHECLWNGYVWPYATSQVITAAINFLENSTSEVLSYHDLYGYIKKYAEMHYRNIDGKSINFIDEVMSPREQIWTSREILKQSGWLPDKGGYERGKDYNHSTFIDLVIRGLIGVKESSDQLIAEPHVQGIWSWFKLENISFHKKSYTIYYDENGTKFGKGIGVIIEEEK